MCATHTLELCGNGEVLPGESCGEVEGGLRRCAAAVLAVLVVNLSVSVVVLEVEVAELCIGLCLAGKCQCSLVLDDTVALDEVEGVEGLSLCGLVEVGELLEVGIAIDVAYPYTGFTVVVGGADFRYLVVEVCEVGVYIVRPVAYAVVPAEFKFHTLVAYFTEVDEHGVHTHGGRPVDALVLDEVEGALVEEVGAEGEAVVEGSEVKTEVPLFGSLPGEFVVDGGGEVGHVVPQRVAAHTVLCLFSPRLVAQCTGLVAVGNGFHVSDTSPRSAEFEQRELLGLGEPGFAGDFPSCGHCGEVAVVVGRIETSGIVAAPACGGKVAVGIRICCTGDDGHVGVHIVEGIGGGGGAGVAQVLQAFALVAQALAFNEEAAALLLVGSGGEEESEGVDILESLVVGQGVLGEPLAVAVSRYVEGVEFTRLALFGTAGREVLVVVVLIEI